MCCKNTTNKKNYTKSKKRVDYREQIVHIIIVINKKRKTQMKNTKQKPKLLCKIKDNLLWIFLAIQVLTFVAIFFDINIDNISQNMERGFWIVALYLSKKLGG